MNTITSAIELVNKLNPASLAAWLITVLLITTGFQRIKGVIAFVLMKLYEFFIQKNIVRL